MSVLLGLLVAAAFAALPLIGFTVITDADWGQILGVGLVIWFSTLVLIVTPYRLWHEQRLVIGRLKGRNRNQKVLNEISALRKPLAALRIEMTKDEIGLDITFWESRYWKMQDAIAAKIREFSTDAEADDFLTKGNFDRHLLSPIPHQIYIDMCARDLDWVSDFVKAYSRGKADG